jgi:gamma-glutamyltranspeptidase / glutathione hydrolase
MVATSQPLATSAGLRTLERGGNAADAALALAAVLSVTEPISTGIGGDVVALVWANGRIDGLDAAGAAPKHAYPIVPVEERAPRSVTVPGAVAGWASLARRHGKLGLDACLADAIDIAERGVAVASRTAAAWAATSGTSAGWATARVPPELSPPPAPGRRWRMPELASTLRAIAGESPDAFYEGAVAEAICSISWLAPEDLASFESRWVEPLRILHRCRAHRRHATLVIPADCEESDHHGSGDQVRARPYARKLDAEAGCERKLELAASETPRFFRRVGHSETTSWCRG